MVKVLVTGGAGYIGSHTIVELLSQNYEIVSIDNHSNSYPSVIPAIKELTGREFEHYDLDLTDSSSLQTVFDDHPDIQAIVHFAASIEVEESVKFPLKYYRNNLTSLMNVLELVQENEIPHFIFSSSCTVYGDKASMPVTEDTAMGQPASPYGATKQMGEQIIADLVTAGSLKSAVVLRYFNPAGAHESGVLGENPKNPLTHLIPILGQVALGKKSYLNIYGDDYPTRDGSCIRDYIHVSDLANAHVKALQYSKSKMDPACTYFNLGFGEGVSVKEAVKAFEDANGVEIPVRIAARRPGDLPAIFANSTHARKELQWSPQRDLKDIMRSAWKFEQGGNVL